MATPVTLCLEYETEREARRAAKIIRKGLGDGAVVSEIYGDVVHPIRLLDRNNPTVDGPVVAWAVYVVGEMPAKLEVA